MGREVGLRALVVGLLSATALHACNLKLDLWDESHHEPDEPFGDDDGFDDFDDDDFDESDDEPPTQPPSFDCGEWIEIEAVDLENWGAPNSWTARLSTPLGEGPDHLELRLVDGTMGPATFEQPADYDQCLFFSNCAFVNDNFGYQSSKFMSTSGSLTIEWATYPWYVTGSMTDVRLVEIDVKHYTDPTTYTIPPSPRCLHIAQFDFEVPPPLPGWHCSPDRYAEAGRGVPYPVCDCECGAPDPDCSNASYPTYTCPAGQTCNSNGECE